MKSEIEKVKNIGIQLLRFILCLWVVVLHCSIVETKHKKYLSTGFHVPIFFLLSFYFNYPIINERKIMKIKQRFIRLLYPYIFWSFISFFLNNIFNKFTNNIYCKKVLTIKDLYLQILFGTKYYQIFWFLFNLIFISLFITIISFIAKKKFLIVLSFLGTISLYIHFSGIYYKFFNLFKLFISKSFGSIITFLPLGIAGCIASSFNIVLKTKNMITALKIILFSLINLVFKYRIFISYPGFMYPNVISNIQISILFLIAFGSLSFNKIKALEVILKYITRNTGGIYYIHIIVMQYIIIYFNDKKTYFSAFIIYIISYMICFVGNKLFGKHEFKYLFI